MFGEHRPFHSPGLRSTPPGRWPQTGSLTNFDIKWQQECMVAKITRLHNEGSCFISSSSSLKPNNTFRDHLTQKVSSKKITVPCNVKSGRITDMHRYFRTCYRHHSRCHSQRRQNLTHRNFCVKCPHQTHTHTHTNKYSHFIFFLEIRFFTPNLMMFYWDRNM